MTITVKITVPRVKNSSRPRVFLSLNNSDFSPLNALEMSSDDCCNKTAPINKITAINAIKSTQIIISSVNPIHYNKVNLFCQRESRFLNTELSVQVNQYHVDDALQLLQSVDVFQTVLLN